MPYDICFKFIQMTTGRLTYLIRYIIYFGLTLKRILTGSTFKANIKTVHRNFLRSLNIKIS